MLTELTEIAIRLSAIGIDNIEMDVRWDIRDKLEYELIYQFSNFGDSIEKNKQFSKEELDISINNVNFLIKSKPRISIINAIKNK